MLYWIARIVIGVLIFIVLYNFVLFTATFMANMNGIERSVTRTQLFQVLSAIMTLPIAYWLSAKLTRRWSG